MKSTSRRAFAALSLALAAASTLRAEYSPPPDNLILTNPSFETDANGNGFADGWAEYINVASASLAADESFEGTYSQRLVTDLASNSTGASRIRSFSIPVVPNQPYTFAYWFKAQAGDLAIANIKGLNVGGGEFGPQRSTTKVATGA